MNAAALALEAQDYETAVSRAYYACYHSVITVLEGKAGMRRTRWDHTQVAVLFRQQFGNKSYLFMRRDADLFESLQEARLVADYEDEPPTQRVATRHIAAANALVARAREVLADG
jgi:uncharacterized protein (UPF0332 family)